MTETRVLVPLDGSTLAENALDWVALLRPLSELRVRLISVVDARAHLVGAIKENERLDWEETQAALFCEYLKGRAAVLAERGLAPEINVRYGSAASEIIAEAGEFAADIVTISTHGRSGFQRWRLGSVADKVLRGAVCNTMIAGPHSVGEGRGAIRSILVPLDGSVLAEASLPTSHQLASALHARLHLVSAVPFPVPTDESARAYAFSPGLYEGMLEGATAYLARAKALQKSDDTATKVLPGPPAEVLSRYIEKEGIDLVVMTSHGRGGFIRSALGSVTDRLIGGKAPVLVVHSQGDSFRSQGNAVSPDDSIGWE